MRLLLPAPKSPRRAAATKKPPINSVIGGCHDSLPGSPLFLLPSADIFRAFYLFRGARNSPSSGATGNQPFYLLKINCKFVRSPSFQSVGEAYGGRSSPVRAWP